MKRKQPTGLVGLVMFVVMWALVAWATHEYVTTQVPGSDDFYQRWYGAQAFFVQGLDPYSTPVSQHAEMFLYGHLYDPKISLDGYPGDFVYPFYLVFILVPLVTLSYAWASAVWLALLGVSTGAIFVMLSDHFNWRMRPLLLATGIIWALSYYPATRGWFLGQYGVVAVFMQLICLWALSKRQKSMDILAGATLAISSIKPQLGILLYPFLLLWALHSRRWRFLIGFVATGALLVGPAFLLEPNWLSEWLKQVSAYAVYTRAAGPLELITHGYLPFLGTPGQLVITAVLLLLVFWACYKIIWQQCTEWFNWTVALIFVVTNLILTRTATPHYVAFLFVFVFYFRQIARRKNGLWLLLGAMLLLNIAQWLLFLSTITIAGSVEAPLMQVPLPVGLLILLLFTRPLWLNAASTSNPAASTLSGARAASVSPTMTNNAA